MSKLYTVWCTRFFGLRLAGVIWFKDSIRAEIQIELQTPQSRQRCNKQTKLVLAVWPRGHTPNRHCGFDVVDGIPSTKLGSDIDGGPQGNQASSPPALWIANQ